MPNLGSNFYQKLVQVSSELGMKPEDLIAVMVSESGMNPASVEKKYKGSGLIGFMPSTLKGLGYKGTWEDFTKLTGEDQLDYVKQVVKNNMALNGGPFTSAAQYYVANLWPMGLKLKGVRQGDPDTPIIEANPEKDASGKYSKKYFDLGIKITADYEGKAYRSNPLFDKDKKGAITYGDIMKQVEINKRSPVYQKSLADMKAAAGYQPQKENTRPTSTPAPESGSSNDLLTILEKYLRQVAAQEANNKKMYKYLPSHDLVIQIESSNYDNSVEFARILCAVLDEELSAKAFTHTNGCKVEVSCTINGPRTNCFEAVKQLTSATADVFKTATSKIGGIEIKTHCITNKNSSYQPISLGAALNQHRK